MTAARDHLSAESLMVETSALVAVILAEPGWRRLAEEIVSSKSFTTCFNVFEAALAVVRERRHRPSQALEIVLDAAESLAVEIRSYEARAIPLAIAARDKYGAGRRGLNMGDCLSYGAARLSASRLLYVGQDFARTDVNDRA